MHRPICTYVVETVQPKQFGQPGPATVNAAFDCPDRYSANLGHLIIRQAFRRDEKKGLPLIRGELRQRRTRVLEIELTRLLRCGCEPSRVFLLGVLDLTLSLPMVRVEAVS